MRVRRSRLAVLPLLAILAGFASLPLAPRGAHGADLENGDFVVGVLASPPSPFEPPRGKIVRIRNGVSTDFCSSTPTPNTSGFFQTPSEVVLDDQGRVVFLAALGVQTIPVFGEGMGLWRCDTLGAAPTMLGAFGGGVGLGYPEPVGAVPVCHAQGLHMKRVQAVDLDAGAASSSTLYVFAINMACGNGSFETIGYDPASGQWLENLVDPVPTMALPPGDGGQYDMLYAGGYTFSGANGGIRGVLEPLELRFEVAGVVTGGLALQRITDLGSGFGLPPSVPLFWDDTTVPNVDECSDPSGGHSDPVPIGTPYNAGGSLGGPDVDLIAWRDGGLLLQGGETNHQAPNITNLALFNMIPDDDMSSMAHWGLAGCSHVNTLQTTPWHAPNQWSDPNGVSRQVTEMDPGGRFGTQSGQVVEIGPGQYVAIHATGLLGAFGIDVYPPFVPPSGGVAVFFKVSSGVNALITASDGRRIGVDLATGAPINDFGAGGYDSATADPRVFGVRDPSAGGFTIETRGVASGAYSIASYGVNLATEVTSPLSFAGTAAPGVNASHALSLDAAGVLSHVACANGIDDDGDGRSDYHAQASLRDYGCASASDASERGTALCDDGLDNDGDGGVDYHVLLGAGDIGCSSHRSQIEAPHCQDGIDNDLAPGIDFDGGASVNGGVPLGAPDPQCSAATVGSEAVAVGGCGFGPELMFALPLLAAARRRRRERTR
jgi:hypothetical protein